MRPAEGKPETLRLGPALDLTPEQLDHAAQITPVDMAAAKAVWREHAPAPLRDVLDAQLEQGGE